MRRTHRPDWRIDAERRQALEDQLKAAIVDLANHMGGHAFFVELNADDGDALYLVFGNASVIKRFAEALPADEVAESASPGDEAPPGPVH
jgi:dienelactone hydrolase